MMRGTAGRRAGAHDAGGRAPEAPQHPASRRGTAKSSRRQHRATRHRVTARRSFRSSPRPFCAQAPRVPRRWTGRWPRSSTGARRARSSWRGRTRPRRPRARRPARKGRVSSQRWFELYFSEAPPCARTPRACRKFGRLGELLTFLRRTEHNCSASCSASCSARSSSRCGLLQELAVFRLQLERCAFSAMGIREKLMQNRRKIDVRFWGMILPSPFNGSTRPKQGKHSSGTPHL